MSNLEPQSGLNEFFRTYRLYERRAVDRRVEWTNVYDGSNFNHEQRVMIEFMIDLLKRVDNLEALLQVNEPEKAALVAQLSKTSK